ncbi:MAG TPA: hypothetical protein H9805_02075 [Candidatus Janibacter merdipullorum]|nr:hypothetical protein [Candidatus Janibacter merdipullorum]
MPGEFVLRVTTSWAPDEAWARVWDLGRHTAVIPLTRVRLDPPATALGPGVGFTGRTGVAGVGFDDRMRVVEWSPPTGDGSGRAVVDKVGRVVGGRIEVTVTPRDGSTAAPANGAVTRGALVAWRQSLRLPWLPGPLRWVEVLAAKAVAPGYHRVLRTLLA